MPPRNPGQRKAAETKSDPHLDKLIENAFDFLRHSLELLKRDVKRSVIEFYTAVELFLKVRLLCEHWTLIISKDADRSKFEAGDFVSVSFQEASDRLKKILSQPLSPEASAAFDAVRRHRNRMVHFFHTEAVAAELSKIALQQLHAWSHLNRLISGEWSTALPASVQHQVESIERALVHHREYAHERYLRLQPELVAEAASGAVFNICPSCTMAAAKLTEVRPWLRSFNCKVCFSVWTEMDQTCPECEEPGLIKAYDGFDCSSAECAHHIEAEDLFDLLDDDPATQDNYFEMQTPANCDECQGYETVCAHKNEFLCTSCLSVFEQLYACGWCGATGTERRENSEWTGCEHCDGRAGHMRDD